MKSDKNQPKATKSKKPVAPAPEDDLNTLPIAEVEKKLESSPDGLTGAEAQKRLTQYGPNELEEPKTNIKADSTPADSIEPKPDSKTEAKSEPATDSKEEPKLNLKAETKSAEPTELKPDAKAAATAETPTDLNPEIAKRAYEIFEERSRQGGPAISDWEQAKQEIENDKLKAASNKEIKVAEPKIIASNEPKAEVSAGTTSQDKEGAIPKNEEASANDSTPQTVQRVHKLYEELGREDIKETQDWEEAEKEKHEHETHQ